MGKSRFEAFSDGVMAIILTIMVLELKVPKQPTLGALAEQIKTSGITSPSVIVVGDVVSGLAQAADHPEVRRSA